MCNMESADDKSAGLPEHPTLSSMLLTNVQQMDPAGWSRLVKTFGPIVYRWCRTSGVSESDAPDLVQDVFASVARGIGSFQRKKSAGSFRSWLATITRNRVRDYFRRQAKVQQAEGGTAALNRLQQQPDGLESSICADSIDSPLVRGVLDSVRTEFEQVTWQAFWLTTVEGKQAADVAATVGISQASVYQAKSRVLRRLRERMSEIP